MNVRGEPGRDLPVPPPQSAELGTTQTAQTAQTAHDSGPTRLHATPAWIHALVRIMDEAIRIPGTNFRFGWDAILGFVFPAAGDAVAALSHVALLYQAFRARVPPVVIARMVLNVAIDELWGSIPIAGDLFDAGFRANRKNLELIERQAHVRRGPRASDYFVVGAAIAAVAGIVLLPLLILATLGGLILHWLQ